MKLNRTKNAISGTFFGIVLKIMQILFQFLIRTIFVRSIGIEYLGLNSLFTAILHVLNLAELGVSSALVFSMYKPIAENDTDKICRLMNLYKRYYRVIGLVVLLIGLILIPFLPRLIKGNVPSDINLYIIYGMNLLSTVLSYWLFAYRNSLFAAHQRNDIINIITITVYTIQCVFQAASLIVFKNYYLFLSILIISQICNNIVTAWLSRRFYPNYAPKGAISAEERRQINQKVRDLFTSKVGSVINNSADSIVISMCIGLGTVAIYQNYYYIISALMSIFSIFFSACTAGIGNSLIVNSKEKNKELLYNINHIVFLAICVCNSTFICVCQPFMKAWVGENLLLEFSFVLLFAVYLFAEEAPRTLIVFKDAGGIWRHDRFRPLCSALVNLSLNLLLTPFIGLYGIIISTIFALLFISWPWVITNINSRLFPIDIKKYIKRVAIYILSDVLICSVLHFLCLLIKFQNLYINILLRLIVCIPVSSISFLLIFRKTEENAYVISLIRKIKRKILRKRKK